MRAEKRGAFLIYTAGSLTAMRMKRTEPLPLKAPLDDFDRVIIMAPVWAGNPAPAIHTVFDALPSGKEVVVCMVSGSGSCKCQDKVQALVESKGCHIVTFENTK